MNSSEVVATILGRYFDVYLSLINHRGQLPGRSRQNETVPDVRGREFQLCKNAKKHGNCELVFLKLLKTLTTKSGQQMTSYFKSFNRVRSFEMYADTIKISHSD